METFHPVLEGQQRARALPGAQSRKSSTLLKRLRKSWIFYVALLPTFVLLGVFGYYPAISGFYHAFYDWHPGFESTYIGLDNFKTMSQDTVFWQSFKNIGQIFLFGVTIAWILPMFAAELVITLSSERLRFIFRTLLIVPFAFPGVVQILIWGFMYDPEVGVFNALLKALGLGGLAHNWLGDPHLALYALMFLGAPWIASIPFLIFLSALQAIPNELFDAAAIDGAGRWRRFLFIDMPLLGRQFQILFVLAIIQIIQYAIPAALLTNGGPAYATMMPVLYLLNTAFVTGDWGYAAALSATLFVLMLLLSLLALRIQRSSKKTMELA